MAETDQEATYGTSIGDRLRQAREAKGLTLDDVATQTRVPIRHLRSIEDGNYHELPAVTYTVGFARSYANAVGLDGPEIGRELRDQLGGGGYTQQVSPEIYAPPDPARVPSRSLAWVAGVLLVVLVAGYLIWRSQLRDEGDVVAETPAAAEQAEASAPPQPQQPAAPANLAGQQVTLLASAPVWFRITDREGNRRLAERTLQAGESYQVPLDARQPIIRTSEPQNLRVQIAGREVGPLSAERRQLRDQSLLANDIGGTGAGAGAAPAGGAPRPLP